MSSEKSNKFGAAKLKLLTWFGAVDENVFEQFGFTIRDVSLDKIVDYFYARKDSSSLAVTRILFGLAMLFDIPDERGGAVMMKRWGDPKTCHFPLLPFIQALPMPYMAMVYAALWIGALGIALGFKFRISSIMFTLSYWYLFLIEKSYWNNHSYLFGVVAFLLCFTEANCYWSIDAYMDPAKIKETVPYWNYFILKYQFFILYFMAGMKKGTAEWLTGYSVQNLSEHWVFNPFKLFLTVPQTDYLIVHWFVFAFDLTVAFWMMWARTRHLAMVFCALFHLMNSRLFRIGMFPWVCLATMPLFYPFDWPKTTTIFVRCQYLRAKNEVCRRIHRLKENTAKKNFENPTESSPDGVGKEVLEGPQNDQNNLLDHKILETCDEVNEEVTSNDDIAKDNDVPYNPMNEDSLDNNNKNTKKFTIVFIAFHVFTQAFLPYSHFITQGYNNWTNGLYGYSWDMMVHTWDTYSVVVKIVDNERNVEFFIDPYLYAPNERWTRHGDMLYQYARCLKDNVISQTKSTDCPSKNMLSDNISIYIDVWCSMNGRFTQRMFDPNADLLNVSWSPLKPMSYLMPLLDDALAWRSVLQEIKQEVHSWHNASDVIFIADFPGYEQEKYIPSELQNVTLTVLEGRVVYEPEISKNFNGQSQELATGSSVKLGAGMFHKILNIGANPAFYMYTFVNASEARTGDGENQAKLPIATELSRRLSNMLTFANLMIYNTYQIFVQATQCN